MGDRISPARQEMLQDQSGSVALFMDGNAGCALLGPDLQEGEAEFVTVGPYLKNDTASSPERRAMTQALNLLRGRCESPLSYRFC